MPHVGEIVVYHVSADDSVVAEVTAVVFWDLVSLRLPDGRELRDVRRVVVINDGVEAYVGRFERRIG